MILCIAFRYSGAFLYLGTPPDLVETAKSIIEKNTKRIVEIDCLISGVCVNDGANKKLLFIGDSHAQGYAVAINNRYETVNIDLVSLVGCKAILGYVHPEWTRERKKKCGDFVDKVYSLKFSEYDYVLVGHHWMEEMMPFVKHSLSYIANQNPNFIVFGQRVVLTEHPQETLGQVKNLEEFMHRSSSNADQGAIAELNNALFDMSEEIGFKIIDPSQFLYDQKHGAFTNVLSTGSVLLFDTGHMSVEGLSYFGAFLHLNHASLFATSVNP